jgi:hypothetical protein
MTFWALAYQYQEDIYYDFEIEEDTMNLSENCFLPTEIMALDVISNELCSDYVPVEITLERLEKNGVWTYTRGIVEHWDEQYD